MAGEAQVPPTDTTPGKAPDPARPIMQNKPNSVSRDRRPRLCRGRLAALLAMTGIDEDPTMAPLAAGSKTRDCAKQSQFRGACQPGTGSDRAKQSQLPWACHAKQSQFQRPGLPRRYAPRNDRTRRGVADDTPAGRERMAYCAKQSQFSCPRLLRRFAPRNDRGLERPATPRTGIVQNVRF